jgi:alpha-galactosidase
VAELTVYAATTGDPRAVRQAAMLDPATASVLTVDAIWGLCDDLTAAHGDLIAPALRQPARY